ncbi:MAG: hypothetical protein RJA70_2556 [Pseudomonadota bacterium]|jgi:NAD(P)H-hydrate epimerase
MRPVLTRAQIREFDRRAVEECGVPSELLMENAGRGAAEAIDRWLQERSGVQVSRCVVVVCGAGHNGGDGFVVARHLTLLGHVVHVVFFGDLDDLSGAVNVQARAWTGIGGTIRRGSGELLSALLVGCDAWVDALFGTGLSRELSGEVLEAVQLLNRSQRPGCALDLPSGLHTDTGAVLGDCARVELTVTFAHYKLGLFSTQGAACAGNVVVEHIGVPAELAERSEVAAQLVERADVVERLRGPGGRLQDPAHKGAAGRVLVLAGSLGMVGAAKLVAHAALRSGAGVVTVATHSDAAFSFSVDTWEAMVRPLPAAELVPCLVALLSCADVVVMGPGFGIDPLARQVYSHVVSNFSGTLILDADALTHFADDPSELARASGTLVLTPHPGEASRLLRTSAGVVEADRFGSARQLAELTHATVLLKGRYSLIADRNHQMVINSTGSSALATAGSGDILAGILAGLACQMLGRDAAVCAAWIHGRAAEVWQQRTGARRGLLAREIADEVPELLGRLLLDSGRSAETCCQSHPLN